MLQVVLTSSFFFSLLWYNQIPSFALVPVILITSQVFPFLLLNSYWCFSYSVHSMCRALSIWNHTAGLSFLRCISWSVRQTLKRLLKPSLLSLLSKKKKNNAENILVGNIVNNVSTVVGMNSANKIPPSCFYMKNCPQVPLLCITEMHRGQDIQLRARSFITKQCQTSQSLSSDQSNA